jgi:hypothetical protein
VGLRAGLDGYRQDNLLPSLGFEPQAVQSVASYCTECNILAPDYISRALICILLSAVLKFRSSHRTKLKPPMQERFL